MCHSKYMIQIIIGLEEHTSVDGKIHMQRYNTESTSSKQI